MNKVYKYTYVMEFHVWEPLQDRADKEVDEVVKFAKDKLSHVSEFHITKTEQEIK